MRTDEPTTETDSPKRPYEAPKLLRFGDVAELTLNMGNMGMPDGGTGKLHGTSVN